MSTSVAIQSQPAPERCPWCGTGIPRGRFIEIQAKIAEQERKKLADERARMADELRAEARQTEARVKAESDKKLTALIAERDQASSKVRQLEAREAAVRKEATAQAEARIRAESDKKLAALIAERDEASSKAKQLEAREVAVRKEATAQAEARIRAESDKKLGALMAERDQASTKVKELDAARKKDLEQQRTALEKDRDLQLQKLQSQHNRDREKLQQKIDGLTRQVRRETAEELGEGGEVDAYDALRDAFPDDEIRRVKKGQPGADIRHNVLHKGRSCGTILVDSKNRQSWQNGYVTKLREDQVADKAEHAILATSVFPSGKKELYVDEETGVIVVNRARCVEVVGLLRNAMVRMQLHGLNQSERAEKRDMLYGYITSEAYRQHQAETARLTTEILELDVEEQRAHAKVWEKRGKMGTRLRNVVREVEAEVSAILEGGTSAS